MKNPSTALEAIEDPEWVSLNKMVKATEIVVVQAFLVKVFEETVKYFNVGKTMNTPQLAETIEFVMEDYWFLKPSELKFCFSLAKKGLLGKKDGIMYDRIDGTLMLQWIREYVNDYRESVFMQKQRTQGAENSKAFAEILKSGKLLTPEQVLPAMHRNQQQTTLEKAVQKSMRRFDKLHMARPVDVKGFKGILYDGKPVTQEQYITERLIKLGVIQQPEKMKGKK